MYKGACRVTDTMAAPAEEGPDLPEFIRDVRQVAGGSWSINHQGASGSKRTAGATFAAEEWYVTAQCQHAVLMRCSMYGSEISGARMRVAELKKLRLRHAGRASSSKEWGGNRSLLKKIFRLPHLRSGVTSKGFTGRLCYGIYGTCDENPTMQVRAVAGEAERFSGDPFKAEMVRASFIPEYRRGSAK